MNARDAAHSFGELFSEVYRRIYRRRDPRQPRPSGESLAMLQHLRDSGPLTVGEAALHFDRSQASISERFERLLEAGLVLRLVDERDRRRHLVWLTPAGEELLHRETRVLSPELLERALEQLRPVRREELLRGMRALIDTTLETTLDAAEEVAGDEP